MQQNFKWFCISCHHNKFRYSSVESFSCYMKKKTSIDNEKKTSIDNLKTYAFKLTSHLVSDENRCHPIPSKKKEKQPPSPKLLFQSWIYLHHVMPRLHYGKAVLCWSSSTELIAIYKCGSPTVSSSILGLPQNLQRWCFVPSINTHLHLLLSLTVCSVKPVEQGPVFPEWAGHQPKDMLLDSLRRSTKMYHFDENEHLKTIQT